MSEITITFQDIKKGEEIIRILNFHGQLDETNVDFEAKKVYEVISKMPKPNLILDFGDLEYMNSKSIGYLTDWYSRAMAKGGKIFISRPPANILDILKVVGITQIIKIYNNIDEAKAAFGIQSAPDTPAKVPTTPPVSPIKTPAATQPKPASSPKPTNEAKVPAPIEKATAAP